MAQANIILYMPTEVLLNIFGHLRTPCITPRGTVDWESYECARNDNNALQSLCNARLVCRRFCQIVSPLLLPVIQVDLNQKSLDRLDALSRSPLIANGVHAIQVVLAYRPAELAADLRRFHSLIQRDLRMVYVLCRSQVRSSTPQEQEGDVSLDDRLGMLCEAIDNYLLISEAWDGHLDGKAADYEYVDILLRGHLNYGKLHDEQLRLIADGSFVSIIASAISRMPHWSSLSFVDKVRDESNVLSPYTSASPRVLTDEEELARVIASPHDWPRIEALVHRGGQDGDDVLPVVKVLSELPIAIYEAGAILRALEVRCFPLKYNHSFLRPPLGWKPLRAACQHLEEISFAGATGALHMPTFFVDGPSEEELGYMQQYIGAILSSDRTERVHLCLGDFYRGSLNTPQPTSTAGQVLLIISALRWPRLKEIVVYQAALHQKDLGRFLASLGDKLEHVHLLSLVLWSGSWADVLDILRNKLVSRCLAGECEVHLEWLFGGRELPAPEERLCYIGESADKPPPVALALRRAERYISGAEGVENPLRALGGSKPWRVSSRVEDVA
jgi:hypothetical protein